jgi:methyl-accepting chemotaxis protein
MSWWRKVLPTVLDTKINNIYKEERDVAVAISSEVTGILVFGVWDFMLPPLFIINVLKHHRTKEAFALNFLFTKKLALEAARAMCCSGQTREESLAQVDRETAALLRSDQKGIYSERIRQKQAQEISLLIDHYLILINTEDKTYRDMVRAAYRDRDAYNTFIHRLTMAEKEVNRAALQTVGNNNAARDFASSMEEAVSRIRANDTKNTFPAG